MTIMNSKELNLINGGGNNFSILDNAVGKPLSYVVGQFKMEESKAREFFYVKNGYIIGINKEKLLKLVEGKPYNCVTWYLKMSVADIISVFHIDGEGYIMGYNV